MKDKKNLYIFIATVLIVGVVVLLILTSGDKPNDQTGYTVRTEVADEYKYNTTIIKNDNAPVEGDAVISSINGYTEVTDQTFLSLPYTVSKDGQTVYEIISIGKCTGEFYTGNTVRNLNETLAIVVKNTTDKVVSFSNISVVYAEGKKCSFTVSNLTPGKSALVFADGIEASEDGNSASTTVEVPYADVNKINVTAEQAVMSTSLPLLEDKVGVDYKDGKFIITNLTAENLGQISVKFMQCTDNDANIYIGGNTFAVYQDNVMPYETYIVDAMNFDPATSTIIAVESYKTNY